MKTTKHIFQIVRIIAFTAMIGIMMAGCDHVWEDRDWGTTSGSENNPNNGGGGYSPVGTWYKSDYSMIYHLGFDGSASSGSWFMYTEYTGGDGYLVGSGTYTYSSSSKSLSLYDTESYYSTTYTGTLTVSGNTAIASGFSRSEFNGTWTRE